MNPCTEIGCTRDIDLLHLLLVALIALDLRRAGVRRCRQAARQRDDIADGVFILELVDRRTLDLSGCGNPWPDRGHEDHVARLQALVAAGIAAQQ